MVRNLTDLTIISYGANMMSQLCGTVKIGKQANIWKTTAGIPS